MFYYRRSELTTDSKFTIRSVFSTGGSFGCPKNLSVLMGGVVFDNFGGCDGFCPPPMRADNGPRLPLEKQRRKHPFGGFCVATLGDQKSMGMAMFKRTFARTIPDPLRAPHMKIKRARKFTRTSPRTLPWNFITMLSAPLINESQTLTANHCRETVHSFLGCPDFLQDRNLLKLRSLAQRPGSYLL